MVYTTKMTLVRGSGGGGGGGGGGGEGRGETMEAIPPLMFQSWFCTQVKSFSPSQ